MTSFGDILCNSVFCETSIVFIQFRCTFSHDELVYEKVHKSKIFISQFWNLLRRISF